ncbi:MAG TPA: peptidylprolyl isomerase, partial [Planctomycetota bacterium]|nr:peptidylprolyl isomerase [Planctomycetota bacterium]
VSSDPPASAEAVRIERVEDYRGVRARVATEKGDIVIELSPLTAALATRNFARIAEAGGYDGMEFHRVVRGLCIQAGDPRTRPVAAGPTSEPASAPGGSGATFDGRPLPLEPSSAVFEAGVVGMARSADELYRQVRAGLASALGATDDLELDARLRSEAWPTALALRERRRFLESAGSQFFICTADAPHFAGRYSAFGRVVEGLDVVRAIEELPVADDGERPLAPVRIRQIRLERKPRADRR